MNIKRSVKQVDKNPHIFCIDSCTDQYRCNKHMERIEYPNEEYLLAHMKDTPYCPFDERREDL